MTKNIGFTVMMDLRDVWQLSSEQAKEVVLLVDEGQVELALYPVRYKCKTYRAEGTLMRLGVGSRIPVATNLMLMKTRSGGID